MHMHIHVLAKASGIHCQLLAPLDGVVVFGLAVTIVVGSLWQGDDS